MAIVLEDAATGTTSAGTTVAATLPGGAPAAGEVLIIVPHGDATGQTLVSDDGLALREIDLRTGNGSSFWCYWRTCDGSEPATLTFRRNDSASDNFSLNVTLWSGCNKANPVGDPDSLVTVASDTATIPAFTTLIPDVVVCTVLGIPSNTTVLTPPTGYTLASEVDGFNPGSSIYYKAQAAAGTTGNIVWVTAASVTSLKGLAFALRPDPGYSYASGIVDTGANTDNAGGNAWSNPTNIQTLGAGASASCIVNGTTSQDFLDGTSISELAAIPAGSTIKGFEFALGPRLRSGGTAGDVRDGTVQLLVSGVASGDNKARTTAWPSNDRKATLYGHPDDLWGLTPTVADAIALGGRLAVRGVAAGADRQANVDCFILTVHYEPPAADVEFEIDGEVVVTGDFAATIGVSGTLSGTVPIAGDFELEVVNQVFALDGEVVVTGAFELEHTPPADIGTGGSGGSGGVLRAGGRRGRVRHTGAGLKREAAHRWAELEALDVEIAGALRITGAFQCRAERAQWMLDEDDLLQLLLLDDL